MTRNGATRAWILCKKDIIDNGHECQNFIFDNGHHYLLDNEEMLYVCEPISEEYFIHKFLEKIVSDFMMKWSIVVDDETFIYCKKLTKLKQNH
jgi:hypothetical protein